MPRAKLVHFASDAPLTVTVAAEQLGISASTLRSWDRRYGLGPSGHQSGSKRRYRGEDIARLERMVELIQAGMPTKDAARAVSEVDWESLVSEQSKQLSVADLKDLARSGGEPLLRALEIELSREGLLHTWSHLIEPALKQLQEEVDGYGPTESPVLQMYFAVVVVLNGLMQSREQEPTPSATRVTVAVPEGFLILGNVVGTALWWQGIETRILTMPELFDGNGGVRFQQHQEAFDSQIVLLLGQYEFNDELIRDLTDGNDRNLILVSESLPSVVHPRLQRVRTTAAGVEETIMLARELEEKANSAK